MAAFPWLKGYGSAYSNCSTSYSVPPAATVAMLGDTSVRHESSQVISVSSPMSNVPKVAHCATRSLGTKASSASTPQNARCLAHEFDMLNVICWLTIFEQILLSASCITAISYINHAHRFTLDYNLWDFNFLRRWTKFLEVAPKLNYIRPTTGHGKFL